MLSIVQAQNWNQDQKAILNAIDKLSAATAPDGKGPSAYGELLAEEFSRWTMGSDKMETKESWLKGIDGWFNDGWRVSDRTNEVQEIKIVGITAFVRRMVSETYMGPKGELTDPSKAAVSEVWMKDRDWKLLRVEVTVLD